MSKSLTKIIIKIFLITLLFFIQNLPRSFAAGKFEDTEKHLKNFEILFLKNEDKKASEEFEKFARTLSPENKEIINCQYNDIYLVYSTFINYVSSFRSNTSDFTAKENENGKVKNNLFALFSKKYGSLFKKQLKTIKTRGNSPDFISYIEELNKNEDGEKNWGEDDQALISAEFGSSMKDADLVRFISGRPLFLFMLYKNLKDSGNDFHASFLKSLISKNVPADILALSGFEELTGPESGFKNDGWAVFDASTMASFNCDGNKILSAGLLRESVKSKTLKKADLSKAAAVKIVFSRYSFYFDIAGTAAAKVLNDAPDSASIELKNGKKIDIKPKKFDGMLSEAAFLKNCKKIRYNNMEFYCCPETANKPFMLNTGSDLIEIVFINFDSGVEPQAILNSFKTL